jgi:hypothetical protein
MARILLSTRSPLLAVAAAADLSRHRVRRVDQADLAAAVLVQRRRRFRVVQRLPPGRDLQVVAVPSQLDKIPAVVEEGQAALVATVGQAVAALAGAARQMTSLERL